MNGYLLLFALLACLALPVKVCFEAGGGGGQPVRGRVSGRFILFIIRAERNVARATGGGHVLRDSARDKKGGKHDRALGEAVRRAYFVARTVLRADHARRALLRGVLLERASVTVRVPPEGMAAACVLSGALMSARCAFCAVYGGARRVRVEVLPDYRLQGMAWFADCILSFRLGTILHVTALAIWAALRQSSHMKSGA